MSINPYSQRSEKVIMGVILLNSLVIFLDASGVEHPWLVYADALCSLFFIGEMLLKMRQDGFLGYWKSGWNRMDGTLVLLSIPSLLESFMPTSMDLSFLLIFRLLRAFRFFRLIHFFPDVEMIGKNFEKGLRASLSLLVGYFIIILIFALLSTALFGQAAPQYFGSPLDSIYSIFRLFTIEGWYDIPDTIGATFGTVGVAMVRLYFIFLLIFGGVIGLSLINSVFVDAMVSDNNDDLLKRIDTLEEKIDQLIKNSELSAADSIDKDSNSDLLRKEANKTDASK